MTFYEKLIGIQSSLKAPKNQKNQHFHYSYRSGEDILEAVKPLLRENALMLKMNDSIIHVGERNYVSVVAVVTDGKEKEEATGVAQEPLPSSRMDASQCTGSASTYARKRALEGLFCLDDTKDADTTSDGKAPESLATPTQRKKITELIALTSSDEEKMWKHYATTAETVTESTAKEIVKALTAKLESSPSK